MPETIDGVTLNPLADAFREQHSERVERLFDLVFPLFEGNWPHGFTTDETTGKRTSTDEEATTLSYSLYGEIHMDQGVDAIEERTAAMIEDLAAKYLDLVERIRTELIV